MTQTIFNCLRNEREAKTKQDDFKAFIAQLKECPIAIPYFTRIKADGKLKASVDLNSTDDQREVT